MQHSLKVCIIVLGIINMLKAWVAAIQKHPEKLQKWTDRKLMKLNIKVVQLEGNELLCGKGLEDKLTMNQQYAAVGTRDNHTMRCTN